MARTRQQRKGRPIRPLTIIAASCFLLLAPVARSGTHHWPPMQVRAQTYRTDPCLAHIIDREDRSWDPTISFGGGHNVNDSYGLPQANPGTKMASAGRDWRTNPYTQLRWARSYARQRYGSTCGAWSFWQRHSWW